MTHIRNAVWENTLSTEPLLSSTESARRPRLAVVGAGWWSTEFHLPGLLDYDGADLVALVELDDARRRIASDSFSVRGYRDLDQLLADNLNLDGIVVATSSAAHYEIAKQALQADLHVMIEKPMVLTASDAWELVELADRRERHIQIGYTHHFTAAAQRLREVLQAGDIGDLIQVSGLFASMVEAYYRGNPEEYRDVLGFHLTGPTDRTYSDPAVSGGGQAQTQLTHAIGLILWVTGLRATQVSAFMENADLQVDLADAIAFRLDNGAIGTLGSTGNLRPYEPHQQEFRYYGTRGYALHDLVSGELEVHYAGGHVERLVGTAAGDPYPQRATACGFADLIAGRAGNLAPGEAGARAVEFLEASYLSAASGQRVAIASLIPSRTETHA